MTKNQRHLNPKVAYNCWLGSLSPLLHVSKTNTHASRSKGHKEVLYLLYFLKADSLLYFQPEEYTRNTCDPEGLIMGSMGCRGDEKQCVLPRSKALGERVPEHLCSHPGSSESFRQEQIQPLSLLQPRLSALTAVWAEPGGKQWPSVPSGSVSPGAMQPLSSTGHR